MTMKTIRIVVKSLSRLELDLVEWPDLHSKNKRVEKALEIARKGFPTILRAIARQKVLSELKEYEIEIIFKGNEKDEQVISALKSWLQRKKMRRVLYIIVELLLMPLTWLMALLPGPNIFFYFLFIFLFFHFKSFLHLSKLDFDQLKLKIIRQSE